jgi:hypothetical protein
MVEASPAELTSPWIYVSKDLAMHGLQMGGVVVAGDEAPCKLSDTAGADRSLKLSELRSVTNPEVVSQHVGAGVDVWIVSHRRSRMR